MAVDYDEHGARRSFEDRKKLLDEKFQSTPQGRLENIRTMFECLNQLERVPSCKAKDALVADIRKILDPPEVADMPVEKASAVTIPQYQVYQDKPAPVTNRNIDDLQDWSPPKQPSKLLGCLGWFLLLVIVAAITVYYNHKPSLPTPVSSPTSAK